MLSQVVILLFQLLGATSTGGIQPECLDLTTSLANLAGRPAQAAGVKPLMVGAAASLSKPLRVLAASSNAAPKLPAPNFNFAASGLLEQQILKGAAIDVFLSAGDKSMDRLEAAGLLLAGSRRVIAGNQLALVVPSRSPLRSLRFETLNSLAIRRIGIGDRTVPAGTYGRQTLTYYGLDKAVAAKLVPLGSARAVAHAVAAGHVDAGIVYKSDARTIANLRIVALAPPASHAPIRYSGAVIATSQQAPLAIAYLNKLTSIEAKKLYRHYGLESVPEPTKP